MAGGAENGRTNGVVHGDPLLRGFSKLTEHERLTRFMDLGVLTPDDIDVLNAGLPAETAEGLVENRVGVLGIPLSLAVGVPVDQDVYLAVPMATEETSVVATVSNIGGKVRERGHLSTDVLGRGTIGQIQFDFVEDPHAFEAKVMSIKDALIQDVNAHIIPAMAARGGGMTSMEVRHIDIPDGTHMAVVQIVIDACDAMGANIVNQVCEYLQGPLEAVVESEANLRILSNLATERLVSAQIELPDFDPVQGRKIERASLFAQHDPYRAATHNKGVMNGVTAVALATGQDTRAIEAGAHTYAAGSGLSRWHMDGNALIGRMTIPMAVGTVGGITHIHPQVQLAHKILGNPSADQLARISAATGLIQNLGALSALTSKGGITEGHMRLHLPNLAIGSGAASHERGPLVEYLRETLSRTGRVSATDAQVGLQLLRAQAQDGLV
jgi:hydroxymethylglutaryl-CoA reductase